MYHDISKQVTRVSVRCRFETGGLDLVALTQGVLIGLCVNTSSQ